MATSPYFNHLEHRGEQSLYDSIVQESIKISGFDIVYIRRKNNIDPILYEARNTRFDPDSSWTIEANIPDNLMGWQGEGQMMAHFGIQIENQGNILISKTRWEEVMAVRKAQGLPIQERPMEGDLVYFGYGYGKFTNTLFQVNHVDFSDASWQMGRTFVYRMRCTLYKPTSDEIVDVPDFDISEQLDNLLAKEEEIRQNETVETHSDNIRVFDETNPFGGF